MGNDTKYAILLSGGAGRIISAIPALECFVSRNKNTKIFVHGWVEIFYSHPVLQDITFDINAKGVFEQIKNCDVILEPEPYTDINYINQRTNLVSSFFNLLDGERGLIGGEETYSRYQFAGIYLSDEEKQNAKNLIESLKKHTGKTKVVIFQPFGSGAKLVGTDVVDSSNRSMNLTDIKKLVDKLSKNYAVVYMGPDELYPNFTGLTPTKDIPANRNIRFWMSLISQANYFIGIDSLGQHIANSFGKKTFTILGSTFEENVIDIMDTDIMYVFDQRKEKKKYSPIRISIVESDMAERLNSGIMDNLDIDFMYEEFINFIGDKALPAPAKVRQISTGDVVEEKIATNLDPEKIRLFIGD